MTITPASHRARRWITPEAALSADALLKGSCPAEHTRCKSIIQSSFPSFSTQPPIHSSANGFVRAVIAAYCDHHHLTIRPEDIWFAILTQLSFFVNAHAEELRSFFVSHAGCKELMVIAGGSINTVNFGTMAERMTKLLAKNLHDPDLLAWIMPDFSTTKDTDKVVASILMMGAMQKYFSYTFMLLCGIPSVTLLGERADWEGILKRLEKLRSLGSEPEQFCDLLKPVLTYFLASFDSPNAPFIIDFWQKVAHKSGGSGPCYLSGWITAFCFWDEDGKSLYAPQGTGPSGSVTAQGFRTSRNPAYSLDGTLYHRVDMRSIPSGFASVPVKVDDNGVEYDTIMVAGSVGIQVTSSGQIVDVYVRPHHWARGSNGKMEPQYSVPVPQTGPPGLDSLQPVSGWWMYEKVGDEEGGVGESGELDVDKRGNSNVRKKAGTTQKNLPPTGFQPALSSWSA